MINYILKETINFGPKLCYTNHIIFLLTRPSVHIQDLMSIDIDVVWFAFFHIHVLLVSKVL